MPKQREGPITTMIDIRVWKEREVAHAMAALVAKALAHAAEAESYAHEALRYYYAYIKGKFTFHEERGRWFGIGVRHLHDAVEELRAASNHLQVIKSYFTKSALE